MSLFAKLFDREMYTVRFFKTGQRVLHANFSTSC
jgi:hypothetical protein